MCMVSFSKEKSYSSKNKLKGFDNTPKWAYIEITNACSHKCAWCYG
jgi:MoaA/NifB/PqqE/SkfB family radical SAM enzyme